MVTKDKKVGAGGAAAKMLASRRRRGESRTRWRESRSWEGSKIVEFAHMTRPWQNKGCRSAELSRWRDLSFTTAPAKCVAVWAD